MAEGFSASPIGPKFQGWDPLSRRKYSDKCEVVHTLSDFIPLQNPEPEGENALIKLATVGAGLAMALSLLC
jgi:hypothetical protein